MSVDKVYMARAKLAQKIGRFEDMTQAVRRIVEIKAGEIDEEQRQLLATAYKTRITPHRNNLRLLQQMQQVNGDDGEESFSEMQQNVINGCKTQIEEELKEIYGEVFELVDKLLAKANQPEEKVFYLKLRADYHRYLSEVTTADERKEVIEKAQNAYQEAMDIATEELCPANATRLSLVLNFAVFYLDGVGSVNDACKLAKEAIDKAKASKNEAAKDREESAQIQKMLSDNLVVWEKRK